MIGLDWVFLGEEKNRDKDKFIKYVQDKGYELKLHNTGDVKYLRIVNENIAQLMEGILSDVYGLTENHKMELVVAFVKLKGLNYSTHELYSPFYMNQ